MTNLQNLIETLKQKGKSDREIVAVVEAVTQASLIKTSNSLLKFIQDRPEASELEKISDETEGQKKLAELYQKNMGTSFEELANMKLEEAASEYLRAIA